MARKAPAKRLSADVPSDTPAKGTSKARVKNAAGDSAPGGFSEFTEEQKIAWTYFLKAYKVVVEDVDKDLREGSDITLAEYEILLGVSEAGGRLRFIDLSRNTLLSQSRISRQIDALQAKGLLKREITATDRRATFAVMTPKGWRAWQAAQSPFGSACRKHFLDLIPAAQLKSFTHVLELLLEDPGFYVRNREMLRQAREANGLPPSSD